MKTSFLAFAMAVSTAVAGAGTATAATVNFTLTCETPQQNCDGMGGGVLTFSLPEFPIPDGGSNYDQSFIVNNVSGILNGNPLTFKAIFANGGSNVVGYFSAEWPFPGGGINHLGGGGTPTYQGTPRSPKLFGGNFVLGGGNIYYDGTSAKLFNGTTWDLAGQVVPGVGVGPSPVPLPSTLLMLATALGALGVARRRSGKP